MTDFLNALKADLLDRRLLPLIALVVLALVLAVGYAAVGGGSSTPEPSVAVAPAPVTSLAGGIAISQSTPKPPAAETVEGVVQQHHGIARNPFTPLAGVAKTTPPGVIRSAPAPTGPTIPGGGGSGAKTEKAGGSTPGGSTPKEGSKPTETPTKPAKPPKPQTVYHVAVLFGVAPSLAEPQGQLTPFENLKLITPLPSAQQPLVVFRGVIAGGKSASFTLVGEAILHGDGTCLPSTAQCQSIDLAIGQAEQLEYLPPAGPAVLYELKVVSIVAAKASAAAVRTLLRGQSKAGRELLRRAGLLTVPYLRSTSKLGILVLPTQRAFGARAHIAVQPGPGH